MEEVINLDNTKIAFANKSNKQLHKSKILFNLLSKDWLLEIAKPITTFFLRIHFPIDYLLRYTVFDQFCGGETIEECKSTVDNLYEYGGVYSILDYSVEGKNEEYFFEDTLETILRISVYAKYSAAVPFLVFKPTGLGRSEIYEKVSMNAELTEVELKEWQTIRERYDAICRSTAGTADLKIMIDAEESWMQKAIDNLVEEMMLKYNKDRTVVFTTLQMYRWDRLSYLEYLYGLGKKNGIKIGVKFVRGAYMEKEREMADLNGYESPICPDKASTDLNFNNAVSYSLNRLEIFELFLGTHNELSCQILMNGMLEMSIENNDNRIWFGQLYGMSDHISYNLAINNYNTSKYVPFGALREVVPYLFRRAEENTSIGNQTTRELTLIDKEIKRRREKSKSIINGKK
ncbi:proline dehydrogenase family protein [Gelidibacter sp. F63206]|uniref:proline dehydrogenase family protein n=1 Tax=Gelidibacter sp. F63206 TaxID=2926425 RepID=UPI001FF16FBB|nr:proline dehydrogenase family protein [Gelidibacter sp. F63206]MCK0114961.1 proline dehydrogenase family protein [Gelidibacter sp. F63206]